MNNMAYTIDTTLPWEIDKAHEERFRKILMVTVGFIIFWGVVIHFLPIFKIDREKEEQIPQRFAKLIVEKKKPPPPPPPKVEQAKATPDKPAPNEPPPKPKKEQIAQIAKKDPGDARRKAQRSGIIAMSQELSSILDDSAVLNNIQKKRVLTPVTSNTPRQKPLIERNLITSNEVTTGSGGLNNAALSRNIGKTSIEGRQTAKVTSPIGGGEGGGGFGDSGGRGNGGGSGTGTGTGGGGGKRQRSDADITLVLDRNKAALYRVYVKALREDPALQGKVVFQFTILSSGIVSDCKIISSELKSPELEEKLAKRIQMLNFGNQDVVSQSFTYPMVFFPSS